MKPNELLSFLESKAFRAAWQECKLTDQDLFDLQAVILARPKVARVVQGTGGLRKLRFSPTGTGRGKSGAYRVCYVYFEPFGVVLLVFVYPKGQKDDLSAADRKAARHMIEHQHQLLARRHDK